MRCGDHRIAHGAPLSRDTPAVLRSNDGIAKWPTLLGCSSLIVSGQRPEGLSPKRLWFFPVADQKAGSVVPGADIPGFRRSFIFMMIHQADCRGLIFDALDASRIAFDAFGVSDKLGPAAAERDLDPSLLRPHEPSLGPAPSLMVK